MRLVLISNLVSDKYEIISKMFLVCPIRCHWSIKKITTFHLSPVSVDSYFLNGSIC